VNPTLREIMGLTSYATILDIPGEVELAIIVVRAEIVPDVLRQCVQKKVKAGVIISAGFAEVDEAGARLQAELVKIARQGGMHFVGPNCVGHADGNTRVASAGVAGRTRPGPMGLIAQSGTLGSSIAMMASHNGIGISKFVSTGNEADLHFEDYLEFLAQDDDTLIIAAYIEGLREGRRFFQLAREITARKPIIAIKTGSTDESGKAARSHTGALAGSDAVYTAAFKQAGVIRADDEEELCDVVVALLSQPLPRGNRVGILTMGGGFGVVTAEACEQEGLDISPLEPQTIAKISDILPPRWSHGNPVDLVGIKPSAGDTSVLSCLNLLMADKNIDIVISLLPPMNTMSMTFGQMGNFSPEQLQAMRQEYQKNTDFLNQQVKRYHKPLVLIRRFMPQPPGGERTPATPEERIPQYSHPRRAARALRHLVWYRRYLDSMKA
jgi:acyl-CoA synthetase (NDP forming)